MKKRNECEEPLIINLDGVPTTETPIPSASDIDYWKLRNNRTFFIDYEIAEDYSLIELSKSITRMNIEELDISQDELEPIYIWIHSYGGDIEQALYFCDLIKSSRIPIITIGMGACMSAGFLIFLAGSKRYAFRHTQMLAHSGSAGFQGTAEQIEEAQKNYKKQIESMKAYILENTKIDEKTFNKNKNKDWYISENYLEEYGICKIIDKFEDIYLD